MANNNKRQREKNNSRIFKKIGIEVCMRCGATPFDLHESGRDPQLVIDHIDNNNANQAENNIQWLCKSCNVTKNHPQNYDEPTNRNAPPEFIAGKRNFRKAKKYIYGRLVEPESNGAIYLDDLINDCAMYVDCSQQQVKNYLSKLTSKRHGDITSEERNGDWFIVWKNDTEMDVVMKSFNEFKED